MASVYFSSSINVSTSLFNKPICSSSLFRPIMVAKMCQNDQSYWGYIEAEIEAHLKNVMSIRPRPESVSEPMNYLTFATPKSTAPALCVAGCELVGGDRAHAMYAASAVHLMHVAAYTHQHVEIVAKKPGPKIRPEDTGLLHFDSEEHVGALGPAHIRTHKFAPNIELLTGDGIMSFAIELLAKAMSNNNNDDDDVITPQVSGDLKVVVSDRPEKAGKAMSPTRINSDKILRVIAEVTRAIGPKGMVEGRYREVEWTLSNGNDEEEVLEYIWKKKEGEIHSCGATCGAILGNGSDEQVESLRKYGLYVGMIQGIINGSSIIGRNYNKNKWEKRVEELRVLAMKELNTNFKGKKFVNLVVLLNNFVCLYQIVDLVFKPKKVLVGQLVKARCPTL